MPEIWSIAITQEGLGACALGLDMCRHDYSVRWPLVRTDRTWSLDVHEMHRIVAEALMALWQQKVDGELPLALVLSSVNAESACFVDADARPQSRIYLDAPPVMSLRDIPDRYVGAPDTASAYRNSVLRCIQQFRAGFCINETPGIATIGAMVAHVLTGHLADVCVPCGVPPNYPELDAECFAAMGICPEWSMERVRCGLPFARISPDLAFNLGAAGIKPLSALAGVPVFHMGASDSSRAYACASDPLSWSVTIGFALRAQWTAGVGAISGYDIQIVEHVPDDADENASEPDEHREIEIGNAENIDPSDADNEETKRDSENTNSNHRNAEKIDNGDTDAGAKRLEKTRDAWTSQLNQVLPLESWPGPGKNLYGYGMKTASLRSPVFLQMISACSEDAEEISLAQLASVPVGSGGLHVIPKSRDCRIIGLKSAHEATHWLRAAFEGLLFTLRDWIGEMEQPGPMRLILDKPWPSEAAQWAADILGYPVFWIDDSKELLAAMGAALALARDLDLPVTGKPSITASIIEPQARTVAYEAHYRVHCALKQE